MNEQQVRTRRRAIRGREGKATVAMALGLALALAAGLEALATVAGLALGRPGWQRGWLDGVLVGHALPGSPLWRELAALAAASFLLCLWPARRMAPTLLARYDGAALRVAPPGGPVPAWQEDAGQPAQRGAWAGLERWCADATAPGALPRLGVAVLTGGSGAQQSALAEAFSRHIDGTVRLEAMGRLAGLAWRLRIKLDEARWWRALPPGSPWDAGYLPLSGAELAPLAAFQPRRATLIVADGLHPALLAQALAALEAGAAGFAHPVRLLVLADRPEGLPALAPGASTEANRRGARRVPAEVPVFELQAA
ncbi:hypothetical protein [Azohydromonas aeria]|uniref:hypothetical protein n=1 Tax=Azohydromonas aeria TaxID=2590212 RepID=UPI0012F9E49E|nr:hypothetical protein [Azohydromonas aeria]